MKYNFNLLNWFKTKITNFNLSDTIYVGFSGGVDSVVLLHLLKSCVFDKRIIAVHINHNLNNKANEWENFCKNFCKDLQIEVLTFNIDIKEKNKNHGLNKKQSIEESARNARYEVWRDLLNVKSTLFLAHHRQDQAETVLYRLFRGTGIKGMSGMAEVTCLGEGEIIRPLLNLPKPEIDNYAKNNNLNHIVDDSNFNTDFDRNFIRHKLLPLIENRWPKAIEKISDSANFCRQNSDFIDVIVEKKYNEFSGSKYNTLAIDKLNSLDRLFKVEIIRKFFKKNKKNYPSKTQIEKIEQEVINSRLDASPKLKIDNHYLTKYRNDLYLLDYDPDKFKNFCCEIKWDLQNNLVLPEFCYNLDQNEIIKKINNNLFMKKEKANLIIKIGCYGERGKKIFQQLRIPPWERNLYPVVFMGNKILAIGNIWYNKYLNFITQ